MTASKLATLRRSENTLSPYAQAGYVRSLEEFGTPLELMSAGGWLLKREIPVKSGRFFDAFSPYPLFDCRKWSALEADFSALKTELVSLVVVTDPFAPVDLSQLSSIFGQLAIEFKQHFVVDLTGPSSTSISHHHCRNVRKSREELRIEHASEGSSYTSEWCGLYDQLIKRHGITGIQRFSAAAFGQQLALDACETFVAWKDNQICGITIWLVSNEFAYYHLAAYSDAGYEARASYGLFDAALQHFRLRGLTAASLGSGAGLEQSDDGLTRFKRGWATHTHPVYLCGRTFQESTFRDLCHALNRKPDSKFFPQYRAPLEASLLPRDELTRI